MKDNPYIGPRPYERGSNYVFAGRDRESRELISLILAQREVLFYAQSGAGKTSLLNAQVIPILTQREGFKILPVVRVGSTLPLHVDPAQVSNAYMLSTLMALSGGQIDPQELLPYTLRTYLEEFEPEDPDAFELQPPLIIFDQFEELFTSHRERWSERKAFFEQVRDALDNLPSLGILFTMREDHVAKMDRYAPLLPRRLQARFRMERLRQSAAQAAVRQPAEGAGIAFGEGVAEELVNNLRRIQQTQDSMAEDVAEQPLGMYVEPVHLQIVCHQLWEKLPDDRTTIHSEDVQQFGDVDQALIGFYEAILARTIDATQINERVLRTWFNRQLITPVRTRSLVYRDEAAGMTEGLDNAAIDILREAYIIRADDRGGDVWYELAHDRLVEPILRANLEWRANYDNPLEQATQAWLDSGRDRAKLLTGELLTEAAVFAETHPADVTAAERRFLAESREDQTRRTREAELEQERTEQQTTNRRRLIYMSIAIVTTVIFALLAYTNYNSATEATRQRDAADSAEATAVVDRDAANEARATAVSAEAAAVVDRDAANEARATAVSAEATAVVDRDAADRNKQSAQAGEKAALARNLLDRDQDPTDTNALELAREAVTTTWSVANPGDRRVEAMAYNVLHRAIAAEQPFRTTLIDSEGGTEISTATFDRDGRRVVSVSRDNVVQIRNSADGTVLLERNGPGNSISAAALSPDGSTMPIADESGAIYIWRLGDSGTGPISTTTGSAISTTSIVTLTKHVGPINSITYSSDGGRFVTAGDDQTAIIWDAKSFEPIHTLSGHEAKVNSASFSFDGQRVITASWDKTARIWDALSGTEILVLSGHANNVHGALFDPSGLRAITASWDRTARIWDTASAEVLQQITGHGASVLSAAFSLHDGGRRVLTAGDDGIARIWDAADGAKLLQLTGHLRSIRMANFSPNSSTVVTAGEDGTVRLWDVQLGLLESPAKIDYAAYSPKANHIAGAAGDGSIKVWDIQSGQQIQQLNGHEKSVRFVDFDDSGRWLVSASDDNTARIWNLETAAEAAVLSGHTKRVNSAAFIHGTNPLTNATGITTTVVTASWDGSVRLWKIADSQVLESRIVGEHDKRVNFATFSPDNGWIMSAGEDGKVKLWDAVTDALLLDTLQQDDPIRYAAFSPDGNSVVTASEDGIGRIWHLKRNGNGAPIAWTEGPTLNGHEGWINTAVFSDDGATIATASRDKSVRLWDVQTGSELLELTGHTGRVNSALFSADATCIVSSGDDQIVRTWVVDIDSLLAISESLLAQNGLVRAEPSCFARARN